MRNWAPWNLERLRGCIDAIQTLVSERAAAALTTALLR